MTGRIVSINDGQYGIALSEAGTTGGGEELELHITVGLNRRPVNDRHGEGLGQDRLAKR